ncbi:hypothetical protein C8R46DRAFT_1024873 [Mycena filopes]|nr:hypothetical protein C8R46DRAFT_1024873 [Mycena filopes]
MVLDLSDDVVFEILGWADVSRYWRALASSKTAWRMVVAVLLRGYSIEKPFFLDLKELTDVQLRELVKLHVRGPESWIASIASRGREIAHPTITRRLDAIATQNIRGYLRLRGGEYIWLVYGGAMRVVQTSPQPDDVERTVTTVVWHCSCSSDMRIELVELVLLPDRQLIVLRPSDELPQDEYVFTHVDLSSGRSRFLRLVGMGRITPHLFGDCFLQVGRYEEPDMYLVVISWRDRRYTVLKCPCCQKIQVNVLPGHILVLLNDTTSTNGLILIRVDLKSLEHLWTPLPQSVPPPAGSASAITHDILGNPASTLGVNEGWDMVIFNDYITDTFHVRVVAKPNHTRWFSRLLGKALHAADAELHSFSATFRGEQLLRWECATSRKVDPSSALLPSAGFMVVSIEGERRLLYVEGKKQWVVPEIVAGTSADVGGCILTLKPDSPALGSTLTTWEFGRAIADILVSGMEYVFGVTPLHPCQTKRSGSRSELLLGFADFGFWSVEIQRAEKTARAIGSD